MPIQTEAAAEEEASVQAKAKEEINRLNKELIQASESLASATGQISHLVNCSLCKGTIGCVVWVATGCNWSTL